MRFKRLQPGQLDLILAQHQQWLATNGKEGVPADLSGYQLRGTTLDNRNLAGARFQRSDLRRVDFRHSVLRGADLGGAILDQAILEGCDLTGAQLNRVDLRTAVGLTAAQLADASLSGALLPQAVAEFKQLDHIKSLTETAEKLWLLLLAGCGYAFLTILATRDAALLPNAPAKLFHGLSTPIPTAGLYLGGPPVLLGLWVLFDRHLRQLWAALAELPRVFPDGRGWQTTIHPWLVSREIGEHYRERSHAHSVWSSPWNWSMRLLVWGLVPGLLGLAWVRYLPRHDFFGTGLQIIYCVASVWLSVRAKAAAGQLLAPQTVPAAPARHRVGGLATRLVALTMILVTISYGAILGVPLKVYRASRQAPSVPRVWDPSRDQVGPLPVDAPNPAWSYGSARVVVPLVFAGFGYSVFADVSDEFVSAREVEAGEKSAPSGLLRGANLRGAQMRYAQGARSWLYNADLRYADLHYAELPSSVLRQASLFGADLGWVKASAADFSNADLSHANLNRGLFSKARFDGATLLRTSLTNALLQEATFQGAILDNTWFTAANLQRANLAGVNLNRVTLDAATLSEAVLSNATFIGCSLRYAVLKDARFFATKFVGCDLSGVHPSDLDTNHVTLTDTPLSVPQPTPPGHPGRK